MTDTGINMRDLKAFPRPVAKVLADAVNNHGVGYRMQDGTHIRLYCGDRGVIPIKVAAERPAEHTIRTLVPWLEQHVESWLAADVTASSIETLAEVVNTQPKPVRATPVVADAPKDGEWTPWKYGLETNGTDYRCTVEGCDFVRLGDARGVHLHPLKHDRAALEERSRRGGKANGLVQAQRKTMRQQAVRVLAEQNHLVVVDKADGDASVLKKKVGTLEDQVEKLTRERDDLKARLDLLEEAFRGTK